MLRSIITSASALLALACSQPPQMPVDPGPVVPVVEHVTRQEILTPLPLRVRLPARYGAERVLVFVRTWGSHGWAMVELARSGQTWSGEVSCRAVSTVTGDTRYFFLALGASGEAVVGSGSPEWPHVATIVGDLAEGPQALPGQLPPARCHDPADCPPDFPGCPAHPILRPACTSHDECAGGLCAWDGYCDATAEELAAAQVGGDEDEQLEAAVRAAMKRNHATRAR